MRCQRLLLMSGLTCARATVVELDHTTFDSTVTKEQLWVVKFYGECRPANTWPPVLRLLSLPRPCSMSPP